MMSPYVSFTKKEFLHIFRDFKAMLFLFITPVLLIFIFSYALSTSLRNVNVAVLMPDEDTFASQLVKKIESGRIFNITAYPKSPSEAEALLRKGKADVAILFDGDFSARLLSPDGSHLELVIDASNPNNAAPEAMYLMGIISDWMQDKAGSQYSDTGSITANVRMLFNPNLESSYNYVPGILGLILMLICTLQTSVSIVREKETGTMNVLLVSPVKPRTIIFAKLTPYFVLCCVDLAVILGLSRYVIGMPLAGSLFWIMVTSLIYIVLGLAIGLVVSARSRTQVEASLICGIFLLFVMLLFCDMLFPVESMPAAFQWFSHIIPAKWYTIIMRKLMIQGTPFIYCIREFSVLCAMTIAALALSLNSFKDRSEWI
ncbi:MAG: ABC transporter permease [Bacteroidia bacterium]|nr:ABC transporter permease [Bacteroidia bacterium]